VPRTLSKLPCLQALILNGNTISKLPPLEIPTLSALVLSKNCLKAVAPEVLAGLPNLAKLSLSHNELSVVPDVSHNRLLHELRLNGNAITRVPALAENIELVLLDVGGNKLSDGWAAVAELQTPKLKNLSLRANCPELDGPSEDLQERFGDDQLACLCRRLGIANKFNHCAAKSLTSCDGVGITGHFPERRAPPSLVIVQFSKNLTVARSDCR
jgi:hypothetical protein